MTSGLPLRGRGVPPALRGRPAPMQESREGPCIPLSASRHLLAGIRLACVSRCGPARRAAGLAGDPAQGCRQGAAHGPPAAGPQPRCPAGRAAAL